MIIESTFGNIDYIFLTLIFLLGLYSFVKGFIHEAISFITLVASSIIGYKMQVYSEYYLGNYLKLPIVLPIFSFIAIFFASYLILSIITNSLTSKLKISTGLIDRFVGFIFGALKANLLIIIFYIIINLVIPIDKQPVFLKQSFFKQIVTPIEKQLFYKKNNDTMKKYI